MAKVPHLRYFFTLDAWLNPVLIGFTYLIANPRIWKVAGAPEFPQIGAVVALVVAVIISFWYGAIQAQEKSFENTKNSNLRKQIFDFTSQMAAFLASAKDKAPSMVDFVSLRNLTSEALRDHAVLYARRMRDFEEKRNLTKDQLFSGKIAHFFQLSDQDREIEWKRRTDISLAHSSEGLLLFKNDFLPEAQAIERELCKRLARPLLQLDGHNGFKIGALRFGMLFGRTAISDSADHIEALARDL